VVGWRLQRVPGVIIRVCKRRIRLKVEILGVEKLVNVRPENVICDADD